MNLGLSKIPLCGDGPGSWRKAPSAERRAKNCQYRSALYLYAMRHALRSMRSDLALSTKFSMLNKKAS